MSGKGDSEDAFFEGPPSPPRSGGDGQGEGGSSREETAPAPARRSALAPLLHRSPAVAVLVLAAAGWLAFELWPDASWYFASTQPVDLGAPGAYQLARARENELVQVRGELVDLLAVTDRDGNPRTVGRLAGTNLLVDRPGRGGPPLFEGRLLPGKARLEYAEVVGVMRARATAGDAALGDAWLVLRDGDRPRRRWGPVAGLALLLVLAAVNARALVLSLLR